ncbi:MAG: helix-turn-helix protein [Flavipsychrobacter sp.]|jgi:predicted transcriptional regulator|nr:helix-turn-helix protein [Flavipsychrobacter sp.]
MENEKRTQARNLYLQSDLTQAQIAQLTGVSQKTISQYISDNKWDLIKERAKQIPALFLEQMNSEIEEINQEIASRPIGKRYPTSREAEVRRKIICSMDAIKERQSVGTHIQAIINFIAHVAEESPEHAHLITDYADKYFTGELHKHGSPFRNKYNLPGAPEETIKT